MELHLRDLKFEGRKQAIDAYLRVVAKFQKWMLRILYRRSNIKVDTEVKISEDDQTIIDFAYIYNKMLPSMYFYQIKDLVLIHGFDLISLLITDFKYLGIAFNDLPIAYQWVYEKAEISLVWYDEKLKLKLEEFYKNNLQLLQLDKSIYKLHILPASLLESEEFANIVKHCEKIRVIAKFGSIPINLFKDKIYDSIIFMNPQHAHDDQTICTFSYNLVSTNKLYYIDENKPNKFWKYTKGEGKIFALLYFYNYLKNY